jgi:hypothetical protein
MSESEDRRRILSMLAEGKISTDEAERLLEALEPAETAAANGPDPEIIPPHKDRPRFLHILIDDPSKDNTEHVNIRVPLHMVRAGMVASNFMPPFVQEQVGEALRKEGIPFNFGNFANMKGERIEEMLQALEDLKIDVGEADGKKVRIFCE